MDNDDNPFTQALYGTNLRHEIYSSRTTQAQSQNQIESFTTTKQYLEGVLSSWSIQLGYLSYSNDNNKTLKCILQLVNWRQKDISHRQKVKDDITKITYDREKYRSLLQQAKRTIEEKDKNIGRLQNLMNETNSKNKKNDIQIKKEMSDDKKMIAMLKSKNQQILHQIKKKQQQCTKITQQFKKNRSERSTTNNGKINNLQIYDKFSAPKGSSQQDKVQYLMEKADQQKKTLLRENLLLKEKLYDIRQQIVHFAQWIDKQLFGQTKTSYVNSFIINHNLLFKKQSIVDELKQVIENAKYGIRQIQTMDHNDEHINQKQNNIKNKNIGSMSKKNLKNYEIYDSSNETTPKSNKAKQINQKIITALQHSPRINKQLSNQWNQHQNQNNMNRVLQKNMNLIKPTNTNKNINNISSSNNKMKNNNMRQNGMIKKSEIPFEGEDIEPIDKLLSDEDIQQSDFSIISHIDAKDISKKKYDKWDILFHND